MYLGDFSNAGKRWNYAGSSSWLTVEAFCLLTTMERSSEAIARAALSVSETATLNDGPRKFSSADPVGTSRRNWRKTRLFWNFWLTVRYNGNVE